MKPTLAWMAASPARTIAFGFGSGLVHPAPGTWGTLFAWMTFVLFSPYLSDLLLVAVAAGAFVLGVWACARTGRDLGVADHGGIVWDEVAAFWLVLALTPAGYGSQLSAFLLFRFFDIVKPPPIRQFDARWKNGFGVMFDDVLAAGYTLLVLAFWTRMTA